MPAIGSIGPCRPSAAEGVGADAAAFDALGDGAASILPDAADFPGYETWQASLRAGQADDAGSAGAGATTAQSVAPLQFEGYSVQGAADLADASTDEAARLAESELADLGYETQQGFFSGDDADAFSGYETAADWWNGTGPLDDEATRLDLNGDYPRPPGELDASDTAYGSNFRDVDDMRSVDALRDRTFDEVGTWPAQRERLLTTDSPSMPRGDVSPVPSRPYEVPNPLPRREEFINRRAGQAGFGVDVGWHDYEEIQHYDDLPIHIRDGEIDAVEHTYDTARTSRWPNRPPRPVHEADSLRKGPAAVLTIRDDDLVRFVGFLQTADGSEDALNGVPLIRVTQAQKLALDDGDIVIRVIDTSTFQPYSNYRLVANLPDGIDGGVSRKLSPEALLRTIAREHDEYFTRHAATVRRQWGRLPLPPDARFQPVTLGLDGVFRPIDLLPP